MTEIENQVRAALGELLDIAAVRPGGLVVIGCSSSEILGEKIGKGSSPETGKAVAKAALAELEARILRFLSQCQAEIYATSGRGNARRVGGAG